MGELLPRPAAALEPVGETWSAGRCARASSWRTSEFLWQEGHTVPRERRGRRRLRSAHPPRGLPRLPRRRGWRCRCCSGRKTAEERFAGAIKHDDLRGHHPRSQSAAAGDQPRARSELRPAPSTSPTPTKAARSRTAWTTSWGASTRLVGGLIMGHGDASGLRLPPRIAPTQVAIVVVPRRGRRGREGARALGDAIAAAGARVKVDGRRPHRLRSARPSTGS